MTSMQVSCLLQLSYYKNSPMQYTKIILAVKNEKFIRNNDYFKEESIYSQLAVAKKR